MATRDHYKIHTGYEDVCEGARNQADNAVALIDRVAQMIEALEMSSAHYHEFSSEYRQLTESVSDCRKLLTDAMEGIEQ